MKDLADEMREAAETLEKVAYLYNLSPVGQNGAVKLSADWLRIEATELDKPIPEDADD